MSIWQFQEELLGERKPLHELAPSSHIIQARKDLEKDKKTKSEPKKKTKWTTSLDTSFSIEFETAKPHPDINDIDWEEEEVVGVMRSDGGSEGLFFVETKRGVLIVKRSTNITAEVFASLLAMKLGLDTPKVHLCIFSPC